MARFFHLILVTIIALVWQFGLPQPRLWGQKEIRIDDLNFNSDIISQMLVFDSGQKLDIDSIVGVDFVEFSQASRARLLASADTLWLQFTIENKTGSPLDILWGTTFFEDFRFYQKIDQNWVEKRSGQGAPNQERDYLLNGASYANISLAPSAISRVYIRATNSTKPLFHFKPVVPSLITMSAFQDISRRQELIHFMFMGAVIIMAFYNLLLFFTTGSSAYLLFVLYNVTVFLFVMFLIGRADVLWLEDFQRNTEFLIYFGILSLGFYLRFAKEVLNVKSYNPKFSRIISFYIYTLFAGLIITLLGAARFMVPICFFMAISGLAIVVGLVIQIALKRYPPSYFFLIATSLYVVGSSIMMAQMLSILPEPLLNMYSYDYLQIGVSFQLAFFSLVLGSRMRLVRQQLADKEIEAIEIKRQKDVEIKDFLSKQNVVLEEKVEERTSDLKKEKEKSDELLLNILPFEIAQELKEKGSAEAKLHKNITVLFTDIKDFTALSMKMSPNELVKELDTCFRGFDNIISQYQIEKIKTIGDSYMAAGGLHGYGVNQVKEVVLAALDIQEFMIQRKNSQMVDDVPYFQIRIGVHTGPVVAGIVGVKKFQYDIWGDTVNIASRMESSSVVERVNISQSTKAFIEDNPNFVFHHRGKVSAKSLGEVDMFFVDRKKTSILF